MEAGRIAHVGTYEQLIAAGVDLAGFVAAETDSTPRATAAEDDELDDVITATPVISGDSSILLQRSEDAIDDRELVPVPSSIQKPAQEDSMIVRAVSSPSVQYERQVEARAELLKQGKLMTREFRVEGAVQSNTLMTYLRVNSTAGVPKSWTHLVTSACAKRTGVASQVFERMHNTLSLRVKT